jgi:protein transport protein SEC61 subunit alpha
MGFSLIHALEPLSNLVPDVIKPMTKPTIATKTAYTAITLFIYLICSQVPLFGIERSHTSDPFYWTRVILASSRGTLMELGIGPIISASWILQIVTAIGLLRPQTEKDGEILEGFEKTFALILCFGEAAGQVWYGAYGPPSQLGMLKISLIILQLLFSGVIVILLDSMLKSGYGLGSGISLFLVANTS